MSKRRTSRKLAMQLVYQGDVRASRDEVLANPHFADIKYHPETTALALELAGLVNRHLRAIDHILDKMATSWDLDRISLVDLAILRVAVAEIKYVGTPAPIVINEAVEMAKRYSGEESSAFVNGILGAYLATESGEAKPA